MEASKQGSIATTTFPMGREGMYPSTFQKQAVPSTGTLEGGSSAFAGEHMSTLAQPAMQPAAQSGAQPTAQPVSQAASQAEFGKMENLAIPLAEEQLEIRKGLKEHGLMHIRKEVQEQNVSVNVPIQREIITIERVPYAAGASLSSLNQADLWKCREYVIPYREETIEIIKKPVLREELRLRKELVQETRQVTDVLRREDIVQFQGGQVVQQNAGVQPQNQFQNWQSNNQFQPLHSQNQSSPANTSAAPLRNP